MWLTSSQILSVIGSGIWCLRKMFPTKLCFFPKQNRTGTGIVTLKCVKKQQIKCMPIKISVFDISVRTRQNFQARALGDFHDRVSSAARAWGHEFSSEAMHVYMGKIRFSLWSYHIDTVFKSIQLSCDICWVSNHHLVHDIHQMVGGLHNLYKFQWPITSCLSYVEYWPENIKTCLPPCGG